MKSFFLCLSIASIALSAGSARAEPLTCRVSGRTAGATTYVCRAPTDCSTGADCPADGFGAMPSCEPLYGDGSVCRARCSSFFGCVSSDDCPIFLDASGTCVPFSARTGMLSEPVGACVYVDPDVDVTYCQDGEVIPHFFTSCHTKPDGTFTPNYWAGDCDGDGCPNGIDSNSCVDGDEPCGVVMRGEECVPSISPIDAGMPEPVDASVSDADGGSADEDGGGNADDDGGNADVDAGGETGQDAGTSSGIDGGGSTIGFSGGGGCRCAVPGGSSSSGAGGAGAVIAIAIAGWLRRRRR